MRIVRRLGPVPGQRCGTEFTCPAIFELNDGRFAIVGTEMTPELSQLLPADAGVADYESIVVIPRETLVAARPDIPKR